MSSLNKISFYQIFLSYFPITILFLSVFNEFDFNYLNIEYFSFNFVHILIFYWTLRNPDQLGYVSIFLAGLINDAIIGIPFGIISFSLNAFEKPKPSHSLQAPAGLLKEKSLGSISSIVNPETGQEKFSEKIFYI